jgi:uncharacterized protein YceK
MKKTLVLIACLLTMLGCSSIPEKKNPDDTIAVLKVNRVFVDSQDKVTAKPEKYMPLHAYYITIDDDPTLHVIQQEYEYYTVKSLAPGPHQITSIRVRIISSAVGKETVIPVSIPFELKGGYITILNQSFDITIQMVGSNSYRTGQKFNKLKPEERSGLVEKLSAIPAFKTWELAD